MGSIKAAALSNLADEMNADKRDLDRIPKPTKEEKRDKRAVVDEAFAAQFDSRRAADKWIMSMMMVLAFAHKVGERSVLGKAERPQPMEAWRVGSEEVKFKLFH